MRVLIDVNVWISYLLTTDMMSPVKVVVDAALRYRFTLLVTDQLLTEFQNKGRSKPYLANRIPEEAIARLVNELARVAERIPTVPGPLERIVRDPKDDYLLVHARAGNVDFLVTGDKDLLALAGTIPHPRIVSPADFLAALG